jgi:hypothetical protein
MSRPFVSLLAIVLLVLLAVAVVAATSTVVLNVEGMT